MPNENTHKYFLSAIVESSKDSIITIDFDGVITSWNKAAELLYGYSAAEAVGKPLTMLTLPEDLREISDNIEKIKQSRQVKIFETERVGKDGHHLFLEVTMSPVKNNDGEVIGVSTIARDITERKHIAETLENAAKRERAMIDNALDVICTIDAEGKFISVSSASLKVWGYSPAELIGSPYIKLVAPEDVAETNKTALEIMSGIEARNFENRYRHKNGSLVDIMWTAFWSEKDNLVFCVAHDITERKAAEAEMRLMKSAIDSVVEGIVISDAAKPDNPIIYANAAFENLTGYVSEEIIGHSCRFLQGAETNWQTVDEIRQALKNETVFRGEILNYRKNGDSFWNQLMISPVFDPAGRLTNFVGVQQDISGRKVAEESLRQSEENFRSIVETTAEWIWATDFYGNFTYNNPAVEAILGYTPEEIFGKKYSDFIHREDRDKITRILTAFKGEKRGWTNLSCRWYHKDGSVRYLESNGMALFNSVGEVVGFRGADRDITENKRIEEEKEQLTAQLKIQHERLNNVIANVPGVVWEAYGSPDSPTQRIDFISGYVEMMLGYTVEEWLTTPNFWLSIVHPEDKATNCPRSNRKICDGRRLYETISLDCQRRAHRLGRITGNGDSR